MDPSYQQTMSTSVSSQSISEMNLQVNQPLNIQTPTTPTSNSAANNANSSPAIKSFFRTLRVGSLKYSSSQQQQQQQQQKVEQPNQPIAGLLPNAAQILAVPAISAGLTRTASTSTFKPAASTTNNTISSDVKHDYSECIKLLQSTAAQALSHTNQQTSKNATLATNQGLSRSSKNNQSQQSIHSNLNQPVLSTFKDLNSPTASPSTYSNAPTHCKIDSKKSKFFIF